MQLPYSLKDFFRRRTLTASNLLLVLAIITFSVGVVLEQGWWQAEINALRFALTQVGATEPVVEPVPVVTTEKASLPLGESKPVRLRIPKLSVDTSFVEVGVTETGEVEVPTGFTEVGWYQYGPTPGELGPAVVLGHVDSYRGPAVFFYLGQLVPGDLVEVVREDDSVAQFQVDKLERYEQGAFPTELVYNNLDHAGIRLVTCSGTYEKGKERYTHNLVVYGSLVASR